LMTLTNELVLGAVRNRNERLRIHAVKVGVESADWTVFFLMRQRVTCNTCFSVKRLYKGICVCLPYFFGLR
jgi:hypothetical protein